MDTTSTYRERRQARAQRLHEWADKREARAQSDYDRAGSMADAIPFGQPVHGARDRRYRERIGDTIDRGVANQRKAEDMGRRADGIDAQLAGSIYDDDPDAVEQLQAKLAGLEAERDRIKAYNTSCRRGARNVNLLDERQQRTTVQMAAAGQLRASGALPSYATSNLSGNIKRTRDRIAKLTS
jgi:hypothetical protein